MAGINQLESLKVLKAVVESGSFTAASKRLNVSAARVSKAIERLEVEFNTTLFNRNTRHMQITDSGERCYRRALILLSQWKELKDELVETQVNPRGKLRISVPMTWGLSIFAPILAKFMAAYPDITLDIQMSDRHVNVLEEEYDLVLRLTHQLADSALLCQRITSYRFVACAAPAYLEQHGEPFHPRDLKQHACLMYTQPGASRKWQFSEEGKPLDVYLEPRLQSNNSKLFHAVLQAGQGIALLPEFVVADELNSGQLVPILTGFDTSMFNLYSLRPKDHMASHRLKLLHEFLYQHLQSSESF